MNELDGIIEKSGVSRETVAMLELGRAAAVLDVLSGQLSGSYA